VPDRFRFSSLAARSPSASAIVRWRSSVECRLISAARVLLCPSGSSARAGSPRQRRSACSRYGADHENAPLAARPSRGREPGPATEVPPGAAARQHEQRTPRKLTAQSTRTTAPVIRRLMRDSTPSTEVRHLGSQRAGCRA